MAPITCNACNKEFEGEVDQKEHYRSEWHRYNLKRKVFLRFSIEILSFCVKIFFFFVFLISNRIMMRAN